MLNTRKIPTADELINLYNLRVMGLTQEEIHRETGISNSISVFKRLDGYVNGTHEGKKWKNYQSAARTIRKSKKEDTDSKQVETTVSTSQYAKAVDKYEALANAFRQFESAVEDFIVSQTADMRRENEIMKAILEEAKMPNLVNNLKKRLENKV